jgi:hypothetical protein
VVEVEVEVQVKLLDTGVLRVVEVVEVEVLELSSMPMEV